MGTKKNRSFFGFSRVRKVRESEAKDNIGNLAITIFFAFILGGILLSVMQNNPLALLILAILVFGAFLIATHRKESYESDIREIIQDITDEPLSKVYIADTVSRYPKAIQILPGRVVLWVVKHGIPVKFIESSINSQTSLIVTKKRSFIPFLYFRGVALLDQESKQSYTVIPYRRITKVNVMPDIDGELSKQVVESIKDSGYSDISFDDL